MSVGGCSFIAPGQQQLCSVLSAYILIEYTQMYKAVKGKRYDVYLNYVSVKCPVLDGLG